MVKAGDLSEGAQGIAEVLGESVHGSEYFRTGRPLSTKTFVEPVGRGKI